VGAVSAVDDPVMAATPTPEQRTATKSETADGSWMACTAAGIAGIWLAVLLISLLAPDMITGSEQEHMPIAAATSWLLWAMSRLRGSASRRPIWIGLTTATLLLWLIATVLSATLPVVETGTDPTRIPVGALVPPIAATVLTVLGGVTAGVFARPPEPPASQPST
jgi:hypothetical protein